MVTDQETLRSFVRELMKDWPIWEPDGMALESLAIKYGLIKLKAPPPHTPCNKECTCAKYYDLQEFAEGKVECYEKTELLRSL